jgi:hypothetical protein
MVGDQPYRIELWDDDWTKRLETLARAGDFLTAKAAFEAAATRRPGEAILLCDRARVIKRAGKPHP